MEALAQNQTVSPVHATLTSLHLFIFITKRGIAAQAFPPFRSVFGSIFELNGFPIDG
jgi:hypothetical protein